MRDPKLEERIARFVARSREDSFDEVALAALESRRQHEPRIRELCDRYGWDPGTAGGWRSMPRVAAADLPARAIAGERSTDGLELLASETWFGSACLGSLATPPVLTLVDLEPASADPRSAELAAAVGRRFGGSGSLVAVTAGGIDVGAARSWLAGRQRDSRPALLLAAPTSLARLIGALERQDLRFRLALGSRVVLWPEPEAEGGVTDGLRTATLARLGLEPGAILQRHSWEAIPTGLYGADGDPLPLPPWVRVAAVDPQTGLDLEDGRIGRLTALDLTHPDAPFRAEIGETGSVEADSMLLAT